MLRLLVVGGLLGSWGSGCAPAPLRALLPSSPSVLAPAEVVLERGGGRDELREVDACQVCHPDAVAQWRTSAHAFASFNNPIYRVSVERLRREVGTTASRACASCHDLALLTEGGMDAPTVRPEDARAHVGVSCRMCHSAREVRPDGNGSLSLRADPFEAPDVDEPASVRAHRAAMRPPPVESGTLCVACHRSFLHTGTGNTSAFFGMDDATAFARSPFAGSLAQRLDAPVAPRDCRGCHMEREPAPLGDIAAREGTLRSHRFLGGHTHLAAMRGDGEALARAREFLQGRVRLSLAAVHAPSGAVVEPTEGASFVAGENYLFDFVLRSLEVGHQLPGGVLDAQDTWLEVTLRDARGSVLAKSSSDERHVLRSLVLDRAGRPLLQRETHALTAVLANHTLAPREPVVVRYAWRAPPTARLELPLMVEATLLHRTRNLTLQEAACSATHSPEGRAFGRASLHHVGAQLDACAPQPVTALARSSTRLGGPSDREETAGRPRWEGLWEYGLGLLGSASLEELEPARAVLRRALAHTGASDRARAQVLAAMAELEARLGRVEEASALVAQARRSLPDHPALDRVLGDAYAAVWRWREAAEAYARCAERAPDDVGVWRALATARLSAGESARALDAAQRGLALLPRDPTLLRAQALALLELRAPGDLGARALEAALTWRPADEAPVARARCGAENATCALERVPLHVHELVSEATER